MSTANGYKASYCKQIIDHCRKGFSVESFSARINTSPSVLILWAKNNSEFMDAIKEAICQERFYWESALLDALDLNEDASKLNAIKSRVDNLSQGESSVRENLFRDIGPKENKLYTIAPTDKDTVRELEKQVQKQLANILHLPGALNELAHVA